MNLVLITAGLMIGLLIFGTLYKYYEVRKAENWKTVPGRVISSQAKARKVRTVQSMQRAGGQDQNIRNFAEVVYEYVVNGKTYKASRVSIGEDLGDFGVEETLSRYPKGAAVRVHYNPDKPGEAVLERNAPEGVWRTMAIFIGIVIALFAGFAFGFNALVDSLRENLARPERAVVVAGLSALALFIALMARATALQVEAAQAWPWVEGVIESSDVESFHARDSAALNVHRWYRYFRAFVVYRYRVGNVDFKGSRLRFGGRIYATFSSLADRDAEAYPAGKKVFVYYNPQNASEAVLEPVAQGLLFTWALAAVLAAGAAYLAFS